MSKVIGLLNAAKTKLGAASNYQLAKLSGISEQAISRAYKGEGATPDEVAARLALILDRPIGEVLAEVRCEDAKTEKSKEFWRDFLSAIKEPKRIGKLAIWSASWWLASIAGSAAQYAECRVMSGQRKGA